MLELSQPWAMAGRDFANTTHQIREAMTPRALEAKRGQLLDGPEWVRVRDGVAILDLSGPMSKRPTWWSRALGWTSYEDIARRLRAALDHKNVDAILLKVDSPGGEASGCDELATAIFSARGKKPIHAFISGMGCSAAYWLASAAERIIVSDAAVVGSIGVAVEYERREDKSGIRTIEFVSAQSPGKGFIPANIQKMVDDMAAVFVAQVARHRGVTIKKVEGDFGEGGVLIGAHAVKAGMVDEVGQFEDALAKLRRKAATAPVPIMAKPLSAAPAAEKPRRSAPVAANDSNDEQRAAAKAQARVEAQARNRVHAILNSPIGKRFADRAAHYAFGSSMPAEQVIETLNNEATQASWRRAAERVNP